MKNLVLMGGGLDTAFVLAYGFHEKAMTASDTFGLFIDYGQRAMDAEQTACRRLCQHYGIKLRTVHLPDLSRLFPNNVLIDTESNILLDPEAAGVTVSDPTDVQTYVPGRNLILSALAASIAVSEGVTAIWTGYDGGSGATEDGYPDTTRRFVYAMTLAIRAATKRAISIIDPVNSLRIHDVSTAGMLRLGSKLGTPWQLTMSCLQGFVGDNTGDLVHCNGCGNCVRRSYGFMIAHLSDPTVYWTANPAAYADRIRFD